MTDPQKDTFRRATSEEIAKAKAWVLANTPVHDQDFDPTSHPEYTKALEIIIFANGGRYPDPDPMPVFVIKGKDKLAPYAVLAYARLCHEAGLKDQADQVMDAEEEITAWQGRHPELVKTPDHQHVPASQGR